MTADTDPAVSTWRIALAPRPAYRVGHHWWRELVTSSWRAAYDHWTALRESGHDIGHSSAGGAGSVVSAYQLEEAEYRALFPAPRLSDFMRELSTGRLDPYALQEVPATH